MAQAKACPSVVLPTPGTPSIKRCPRAKILASARRTTSSFPRITRRSARSSCSALCDAAIAVSGDIEWILLSGVDAAQLPTSQDCDLAPGVLRCSLTTNKGERPARGNLPAPTEGGRSSTAGAARSLERFLLLKFRRPPRQPLDPLRNRRMRRKQVRKIHPQQRLNDKKMSRRRRGHHRHAPRIRIQLLQSARQSVRIPRKVSPGSVRLIFPRARHRQLYQARRNRSHNQHQQSRQPSATPPPIAVATL